MSLYQMKLEEIVVSTIIGSFCNHKCEFGKVIDNHLHLDAEHAVYYCSECDYSIPVKKLLLKILEDKR